MIPNTVAGLALVPFLAFGDVEPAVAEELWLVPDGGSTLNYYYGDPEENPEGLTYSLGCLLGEQSTGVAEISVTIWGDDASADIAAKLPGASPYDQSGQAVLSVGNSQIPAGIWNYSMQWGDMDGWALVLELGQAGQGGTDAVLPQLSAAIGPTGAMSMTVLGHSFDLTPRLADVRQLREFLTACSGRT